MDRLEVLHNKVKHGIPKIQKKKVKDEILKDSKPKDYERETICKNARKTAHNPVANIKREISNEVREQTRTLSESLGLDFLEEGLGYSDLDVTIFEEPVSTPLSESLSSNTKTHYKALGVAEGVFAPIGAMSRNNRRYDDDHWECVLENQHLKDKISSRGMLGTIGHHNKKVDDADLASGEVSHIVTDLRVCEDKEGKPILFGKLEILNTPKGQLLKEYYEMGIPLYVSSRGGGKLLPVANESWKRVDKTNYYLETFDVVLEPGFLQAKPQYVHESLDESNEIQEEKAEESTMKDKKQLVATDMTAEEIVNNMLHLDQKIDKLTKIVEEMTEKVFEGHDCKEKEEEKKDRLEAKIEKEVAKKEEKEAKEEEKLAEVDEACKEEKDEEKKEKKAEEIEAKKEEIEAKEDEKLAKDEKELAKEDKKEVSEKMMVEEEPKIEDTEKADEEHDENDKEKRVEEIDQGKIVEEKEHCKECGEEECKCEKEECAKEEKVDEEIDYKSEYEKSEKMVEALVPLVEKASKDYKAIVEELATVRKELNSYKLSEEFNITIDEAKEKLAEKSYDELREELKSAIEESKEAEAKETTEKIAESKDGIIAESKHVRVRKVKVHSAFND